MSCPVCLPGSTGELCDAHGFTTGLIVALQGDSYAEEQEMALVECETPQTIDVEVSLYDELTRDEMIAFVRDALNGGGDV